MLFLQYKEVRLVKIPWLSGSDFNYTTYLICRQKNFIMCHILLSATFVQSLLDCFICALSKIWEYLNGTKGIYTFLHYCLPIWETWKATFFYPVLLHYVLRATLLFQLGECTTFLSRDKTHTKYNKPASYSYLPQEKKTGSRAYFLTF